MDYKNIVIGGMGLAGSTLCFNICRYLIEEQNMGYNTYLGSELKHSENLGEKKINLIKSHQFYGLYTNRKYYNILTIRDLRDTTSSMIRKTPERWDTNKKGAADYNMGFYNSWINQRFNFYFIYEDYKNNPFEIVSKLSKSMGCDLSDDQLKKVIERAENLINDDKTTTKQRGEEFNKSLLTKRHNTNNGKIGSYKSNLDEATIKYIETKYKYFFEKHGYK